jgi:Zn-dependent peptidase ImmA (M78 family)
LFRAKFSTILTKVDARVRALLKFYDAGGDPADLIDALCVGLLEEAGAEAPVDLEVLASFRNARVSYREQEQPEMIQWDGRNFQIRIRSADTFGRQRFSCAHAIVHTWFLESAGHNCAGLDVEQSWSEAEEELCDLGAAALLMPEATFRQACPAEVDMGDVLRLADDYQASAEATALRAVTLSPTPLAMIVLEMGLKPADQKALALRRSPSRRLGTATEYSKIEPRLRVVKRFGRGVGFLPLYKSVGADTPLASILDVGGVDYIGGTGILGGTFRVSARNLPIRRGDKLVDRVVALIAPHV